MTFVSYAQNFEDVMLWRALKHVEGGFYVDVGAQDPAIDSVSLAFYEHGWRGVHIEPSLVYADKLRRSRPDEIVIQAAIAAAPSTRVFFEIPDTGLSTADREIAERHRAQGFTVIETVVPYLTLTQALEPFAGRDIHWLKIDVEGFEGEVIQGWDATAIRPWVLVVESMAPNRPEETHLAWESQVIQRGYDFVYFDGLNRYYISADHRELAASFDRPPNYFDFFVINQVVANDAEIGRLRGCVDEVTENLAQARSDLSARDREIERLNAHIAWQQGEKKRLDTELTQTQAMLAAMYASTSWRASAPLRAIATGTRRLKSHLARTSSQPQAPAQTTKSPPPENNAPIISDAGGSVDLTEYTRQVYRHLLDARATAECQQRMTLRPVEDR